MSQRFYITKALDILEFVAEEEWGYPKHRHHFFELTFILKGKGRHLLNESSIPYVTGDIFFLTPKDEHEFRVDEPTRFGIIKFTEQLFLEKSAFTSSNYWRRNLETVIFHSNIMAQSILNYEKDKNQFFGLYELIKNEMNNTLVYNRNVLSELFGALLIVLSRNLKAGWLSKSKVTVSDQDKIESILTYIRQNILNKELMNVSTMAREFHLSPNYLGAYIKKHTGISLQRYIMETKVKMAANLLKQSHLSIGQVAEKTGFVDASHFNKTFKKYMGSNPGDYQLQQR